MVRYISTRVAVMYLGKLMELTTSAELYENPLHPYTKALLSAIPIPDPPLERQRQRMLLEGDVPSPANPPAGCNFSTRCPLARDSAIAVEPEFRRGRSGPLGRLPPRLKPCDSEALHPSRPPCHALRRPPLCSRPCRIVVVRRQHRRLRHVVPDRRSDRSHPRRRRRPHERRSRSRSSGIRMGFDRPWYVQYFSFVGKALQGDFGYSFIRHKPAYEVITERLPATIQARGLRLRAVDRRSRSRSASSPPRGRRRRSTMSRRSSRWSASRSRASGWASC